MAMMQSLREQLNDVGLRLIDELAWQVEAALKTRPCAGCFFTGPAGSGKTFLAESLGQVQERRAFFFQAFPGCRKEELYQTILPDASQPSGFRTIKGVLPQAAESSQRERTALILDEWDKTHPSTDAFLLDFLQNGRVSVPGSEIRANQQELVVFITLNDERELSEPLLRRLPLIELQPPPAHLVEQVLRDTHDAHPFLPAAVTLYRRSLLVNLAKPVTIQELRQLLDAIDLLGERADWNSLVFQFISKNWDDHELLKTAEDLPLPAGEHPLRQQPAVLDVKQYEPSQYEGAGESARPDMPRIQRDWLGKIPERPLEIDAAQAYGVVPHSESGYDGVARAVLSRPEGVAGSADPADLKIAQVGESEIIVFQALNFERVEEWGRILEDGGELLLEVRHNGEISQRMLLDFKTDSQHRAPADPERCRIYSVTGSEMLMRYRNLKVRWTPELLEVVAADYPETRELWEFLFGQRGTVTASRLAVTRLEEEEQQADELPPNQQMREDYLFVLRDFRNLREWFALLINRNLRVWERVTCEYRNLTVVGSALPAAEFKPDKEHPDSKEEAESITVYRALTQPALDYYESHLAHIESELTSFVAKNGEFPPAVEDGGIFGLHELHTDLGKIKRQGLKLYMRKMVREV
ncbi:MAG: AAA family ATPase [SAR324 cluster bacterium]|nr:AAA family ATPase [SAR324 cluster bacterium]